MTSEGKLTIPADMLPKHGTMPDVEATDRGPSLVVDPEERARVFREWLERMRGTIDLDGMTTDEYMNWLRGYDEDGDDPGFQMMPVDS